MNNVEYTNFTKSNSSFLVWFDNENNEYYDTTKVYVDSDLTLTAKFISADGIQAFLDAFVAFTIVGK